MQGDSAEASVDVDALGIVDRMVHMAATAMLWYPRSATPLIAGATICYRTVRDGER